jgi:hypothetical protein
VRAILGVKTQIKRASQLDGENPATIMRSKWLVKDHSFGDEKARRTPCRGAGGQSSHSKVEATHIGGNTMDDKVLVAIDNTLAKIIQTMIEIRKALVETDNISIESSVRNSQNAGISQPPQPFMSGRWHRRNGDGFVVDPDNPPKPLTK